MRVVRLSLIVPMLLSASIREDTTPYITTLSVCGPFDESEYISLKANGDYTGCRLFAIYSNVKTNSILATERSTIEYYSPDENGVFNYLIRTEGRVTKDGLRIKFSLSQTIGTGIIQEIVLYPTNKETIYSYQYRNTPYRTYDHTFQIIDKNTIRNYEEYQFENTIDYITNSVDNYLEIGEVSFSYDNGNELINLDSNKYLRFRDPNNLFPLMEKDDDDFINVPLKCVQKGSDIFFDFNCIFFYTKSNGYISMNARPKATRTTNLILPKAGIKKLEDYDFTIEMDYFGRCGNKVIIPLQFYKDRNYTGLCSDSNYCIVGGIRE